MMVDMASDSGMVTGTGAGVKTTKINIMMRESPSRALMGVVAMTPKIAMIEISAQIIKASEIWIQETIKAVSVLWMRRRNVVSGG